MGDITRLALKCFFASRTAFYFMQAHVKFVLSEGKKNSPISIKAKRIEAAYLRVIPAC